MESYYEDFQRLALAALLGALIGMEREWKGKEAGLRTLMLVSAGSALFTIISYRIEYELTGKVGDVTRIAAGIVQGIGFLGAGLIFKSEGAVYGLTTATTVWAVAAVGMAAGTGMYELAIAGGVLVALILVMIGWVEHFVYRTTETRIYTIRYTESIAHQDIYKLFFNRNCRQLNDKIIKSEDGITRIITVRAKNKYHKQAVAQMIDDSRVLELRY